MRAADLEKMNIETRRHVGKGDSHGNFYGYIDVEIPGCPPFVMFQNSDCSVAGQILQKGTFEPTSLRVWCTALAFATSAIDVGAYTGIYTLIAAAMRPDITVYSFEPNPYSFARLRVNCGANQFRNVDAYNWGIGSDEGHARLSWPRKTTHVLPTAAGFSEIDAKIADRFEMAIVEMHTLNRAEFCESVGERAITKVDVEGAEGFAIQGMIGLLDKRADMIIESFKTKACEQINALSIPRGYQTFLIDEESEQLIPRERMLPCDPYGKSMNQLLTVRPETFAALIK